MTKFFDIIHQTGKNNFDKDNSLFQPEHYYLQILFGLFIKKTKEKIFRVKCDFIYKLKRKSTDAHSIGGVAGGRTSKGKPKEAS